jgi:hypothetical protein
VEDAGGDGVGAIGDVWGAPGQQFIEHGAERVEVGPVVYMLLSVELLRRHILWCADGQAGAGERWDLSRTLRLDPAGDAEVGEQHAAFAEKDVVGLDIAMDQPQRVNRGEGGGDLDAGEDGVGGMNPLAAIEQIAQGAVEQGHHEVEIGSLFAIALDGNDVGMGELADKGGLIFEALDVLGIGGERWRQHFDGDIAIVGRVTSAIDLSHAADVEQVQQQVISEPVTAEWPLLFCHIMRSVSSQRSQLSIEARCDWP